MWRENNEKYQWLWRHISMAVVWWGEEVKNRRVGVKVAVVVT